MISTQLKGYCQSAVNGRLILSYYRLLAKFRKNVGRHSSDGENLCVFFLSTGRVGTKTISALLGLSKAIMSFHEPFPTLYSLSALTYERPEYDMQMLSEALLIARSEYILTAKKTGLNYVETSPQVTFLAPVLKSTFPNARFVHVVRNPIDVVRSAVRRNWHNGHYLDSTRIKPRQGSSDASSWDDWSILRKNAWLWGETNRSIEAFCALQPKHDILNVKAEDIFLGDPNVISELFSFCGSDIPNFSKINEILSKKLNSQKTGGFLPFDEWSTSMKRILFKEVADIAIKYGYTMSL